MYIVLALYYDLTKQVRVVKSTKKIKMGTCKSECDPHMTTFDQR